MEFSAYHNSHDLFFRNPFGAVTCGQKIVFRLGTCSDISIEGCYLRLWEGDKEKILPMNKKIITDNELASFSEAERCCPEIKVSFEKVSFEVEYRTADEPGLVWYYFIIPVDSKTYYFGNNPARAGGVGKLWEQEPPAYQVTVHLPMKVPQWYKKGVMYQIFVDRFYNGNENGSILRPRKKSLIHSDWYDTPFYIKDGQGRVIRWNFFGGNLKGVLKKLPYLKELGVSIIYFNPIFDSSSNHKYDTADYLHIDPMYGDESDFELLVKESAKQGISIILDGVFSHTGSDSIYFNKYGNYPGLGGYQSPDSPYFKWYKFKENPDKYKCWWGVEDLPEVDEMEPSYRQFIYGAENSVIKKWMQLGVKGWRLDVADELPDEFIKELRQAMKQTEPDSVLIGEVWEDASNKISYGKSREYLWGEELDSTMNYPFREIFLQFILGDLDAQIVDKKVMSLYENYPRESFYAAMNLIGSHDRARILTLLGEAPPEEEMSIAERESFSLSAAARNLAVQRLKLLSLVQMTFPGVPCVYYGDEAGLEGYSDPYNRGTYPWGREDKEILEWYKRIIRLRQEYEVLQTGEFVSFSAGADVYGYKRIGDDQEVIILINRHSTQREEITLSFALQPCFLVLDLLSGNTLAQGEVKDISLEMGPLEGKVLLSQKGKATYSTSLTRSCGILMHISSLYSPWGIGDLGEEAYRFVNFLTESGQNLWQVLPLNPVGLGYSPYQSDSAFAGNSLLISIDQLIQEGLLNKEEAEKKLVIHMAHVSKQVKSLTPTDYQHPYSEIQVLKNDLLRLAFKRFQVIINQQKTNFEIKENDYLSYPNYISFQAKNKQWLDDYALFLALKSYYQGLPWYDWEPEIASRQAGKIAEYSEILSKEMEFTKFVQYTFYYQWQQLKRYANDKGIKIIGDMPIFVAGNSCDIWANRQFFLVDERGRPFKVAGVPPDYFSKTGQLWGNPIYDWDALANDEYSWWKKRIKQGLNLFDYIRLDHFRGFEAYWEIPAGQETAEYGRWMKGPGKRFFESLAEEFGELPFIAEDLGVITPEVNVLKTIFGFPGMKVLQFTPLKELEEKNDINVVYYTGTHDNDTLLGWYKRIHLRREHNVDDGHCSKNCSSKGCDSKGHDKDKDKEMRNACLILIEKIYGSKAPWVIIPMQDFLSLDSEARMNTPGTINGNWKWRIDKDKLTDDVKEWLRSLAMKYRG